MDIQLYFEKSGSGEPLILLHGNGEDHTYFAGQIPHFAERFTVYAVDTRGHGKSPMGTAPFTLSQFAEDLCDFMDEQGIGKAHILGFSDGANIALLFALRHPERLLSLVLNSGNLDPSGLVPALLDELQRAVRTTKDPREAALLRLMLFEPNIDTNKLKTVCVPSLVIAGDNDLIAEAHTRMIAASLPNAALVILPGTHALASQSPETFNRAVDHFFETCRKM